MSQPDLDLTQLRAAARAYLEWEAEISPLGIPQLSHAQPATAHAASPAASPRAAQAAAAPASPPAQPQHTSQAARPAAPTLPAAIARGALPDNDALPVDPTLDKRQRLALLDQQVRGCNRCALAEGRTHTVFARGNPDSPITFVGEGPGQEEDRVGSPFVGAAGQLLDKMVAAMGFARDDVYICNVVKCRPPGNRTPLPVEAQACAPYLLGQLEAIRPRVIVALGRCAAENMGLVEGGGWRGRWGSYRGFDVMPTYHPAFLLRSPEYKRPVWEDLQKVMSRLKGQG